MQKLFLLVNLLGKCKKFHFMENLLHIYIHFLSNKFPMVFGSLVIVAYKNSRKERPIKKIEDLKLICPITKIPLRLDKNLNLMIMKWVIFIIKYLMEFLFLFLPKLKKYKVLNNVLSIDFNSYAFF